MKIYVSKFSLSLDWNTVASGKLEPAKQYLKSLGYPGIYEPLLENLFNPDTSQRSQLWEVVNQEPFHKIFEGDINLKLKMPKTMSTVIDGNMKSSNMQQSQNFSNSAAMSDQSSDKMSIDNYIEYRKKVHHEFGGTPNNRVKLERR